MKKRFALPFLAAVLAACSGGDSTSVPKAGPPTKIAVVSGSTQTAAAGEAVSAPLVVKVTDANNLGVSKVVVNFTIASGGGTLSQAIDTTDADGNASVTWTAGSAVGDGRVEARAAGVVTVAAFTFTINAGAPNLMLQVSNPVGTTAGGFEAGDSIAVRLTDKFNNPIANSTVTFAVTSGGGSVSSATRTTDSQGTAKTAWTIGNAGAQTLRATSNGLNVDITASAATCSEVSLAVGDVATFNPNTATCILLNGSAKRYFITVSNPTNSAAATVGYTGRGASGALSNSTVEDGVTANRSFAHSKVSQSIESDLTFRQSHQRILQQNMLNMPTAAAAFRAAPRPSVMAQSMPPVVGDMVSMKIPNLSGGCNTPATPVRAKVVYVGTKGIMLEDSANVTAGTMDTLYASIGQEFDNVMYPILITNFGDPLALDSQLDNDGHLYMLFSTKINTLQGGTIAGFVYSCDFGKGLPASNGAEIFYARAPTSPGLGFGGDSVGAWKRQTRTVIIHEVKHIASFAQRIPSPTYTNAFAAQDQWLEESSAMAAEEIWGRGVFGTANKQNTDYRASIYCEVRPQPVFASECGANFKPTNMIDHFAYLNSYEKDSEGFTMLGQANANDFNFYGAGWAFLRWAADAYATSDASFFKAINTDVTKAGIANIEARTGKTYAELFGEFSVALATDDYPGFTPKDVKYSMPSWNTRNIWTGLNQDFPSFFTNPSPLKLRTSGFGKFTLSVNAVRGGGFSTVELSGNQSNKQMIELKGAAGTNFPAEMRVNIVRIQ